MTEHEITEALSRAGRAIEQMECLGLEPLEPFRTSDTPWRCLCVRCGDEVTPRLSDLRKGIRAGRTPGGCNGCSRTLAGRAMRTSDEDAIADMNRAGLTPLEPYPGGHSPWRSRCQACEREVAPALVNIRSGQGGCRPCADERNARARRTTTDDALRSVRAAGLIPCEPFPGLTQLPWRLRCGVCASEFTTRLNSVRNGSGCPHCATGGFDPEAPAVVYLIEHSGHQSLKIGIAGKTTRRLRQHQRHGWETVRAWDFAVGREARDVEKAALQWLRNDCGVAVHLGPAHMPQGGFTETFARDQMDAARVIDTVDALIGARPAPMPA